MKKQLTKKLLVSTFALVLAATPVALTYTPTTTAKAAKNAMGYELGFSEVATLDFTEETMIVNPKDETRSAAIGELRYWDYAGDLLSIVDDANAKSGKAVQVASAQDFPRTSFEVESDILYKFSYKIKMTDESKWDTSLGISPYVNFNAKNAEGDTKDDPGHDFHRDYADVVYEYSADYKTTEFYFATTLKGERMTINLYDTFENALAKNERDSYKFEAGYTDLGTFDVAFYTQGGAKTMPYQISDITLSAYSVISGEEGSETATPLDFNYDVNEELCNKAFGLDFTDENSIIADGTATDSASNPGKVVVNGKDEFLTIVDDSDTASGKALQVKNATDFPRLRINTLVAGKPYKVSYKIKMTDESQWPAEGGSLGITPYLNFTTYNPDAQNWQPDSGWDFHCGYKDVQYSYNNTYKTVEFYFETEVVENKLVLNLYGDAIAYQVGLPTATFTFNEGFVELAAVDIAFYKQGSASGMAYRIADIEVMTVADPVVEPPVDSETPNDSQTSEPATSVDSQTSVETPTQSVDSASESGCKSVIGGGFAVLALCGVAAAVVYKRKEN